jgi:hypothetical protein
MQVMYPQSKRIFIHVLSATIGGARGIQSAGLGLRVYPTKKVSACDLQFHYGTYRFTGQDIFIHGGGRQAILVWDSLFFLFKGEIVNGL